ncbi:integral membrane protein [Rutstroemia sp. NJR-2017a WRK4]|nr:integral membrane protein [Rutstroemia sp. NJR-2017a WRK4]
MQRPPAYVLASWPKPNYIDPVTHGYGNVIMNIVLYWILCMFLSLRIWTRTRLRASFGADDVMILLAMVCLDGFLASRTKVLGTNDSFLRLKFTSRSQVYVDQTSSMYTRFSFEGRPVANSYSKYDIPVTQVEFGLKMVLLVEIMFASACTLTKLSMLMLVRRMLAGAALFWRRVVLCAVWVDYWKVTIEPQPNCINQASSLLVAGVINTLTDFLVVLLPIRAVSTCRLPPRQTMAVSFLFTLGFLSCFAGIIRTYYMWRVTQEWDQVWHSYPVWVSAAVELYIGIICTSIPATKAFFQNYFPRIFSTSTHGPLSSALESEQVATRESSGKDGMELGKMFRRSKHAEEELGNLSITSISTASRAERRRSGDGIERMEGMREKNRDGDASGNWQWNRGEGIQVVRTIEVEEEGRRYL